MGPKFRSKAAKTVDQADGSPPLGFSDAPVGEDKLELGKYMTGLAEFIERCPTPMTIAVQGDWGTGKTTTLRILESKLENGVHPPAKIVNLNTWQFSHFALTDQLALNLIARVIDSLDENHGSSKPSYASRLVTKLKKATMAGSRSLVSALLAAAPVPPAVTSSLAVVVDELVAEEETNGRSSLEDPIAAISELREAFAELVEQQIQEGSSDRVVVFVDDLDRIDPLRAIEVMEAIKVFLDVPGCVFVLAIDFDVVKMGVRAKYGEGMDEGKARSFFDKMIQVPFLLPVAHYKTDEFLHEGLVKSGLPFEKDTLPQFVRLASASIGSNPRSLKRLLNTFVLLGLIQHRGEEERAPKPVETFATLCLQIAFPRAYSRALDGEADSHGGVFGQWIATLASDDEEVQEGVRNLLELGESDVDHFKTFLEALVGTFGGKVVDGAVHNFDATRFDVALGATSVSLVGESTRLRNTDARRYDRDTRLAWARAKSVLAGELGEVLDAAVVGSDVAFAQSSSWWSAHKRDAETGKQRHIAEVRFNQDGLRAAIGTPASLTGTEAEKMKTLVNAATEHLGAFRDVKVEQRPGRGLLLDCYPIKTREQAEGLGRLLVAVSGKVQ